MTTGNRYTPPVEMRTKEVVSVPAVGEQARLVVGANVRSENTLSVVTPNLNMGRYLEETIESVLRNLGRGDEYFVIDGGSSDRSVDIIRSYEDRLTGWLSEPDRGYADAVAKGFARATGDILCWVNASDVLLPGSLDAAREALAENSADMIFGDDFYIDEHSRVISFSRGQIADLRDAMLYGGWTPLQDACFWRRTLYERVGGIDPSLRYATDYDLFLRMALHGKAVYVPLAFSGFRRHAGQKSIAGSAKYEEERAQARQHELARLAGPRLSRSLRSLWHGAAVRWHVHVRQRGWQRPDLRGRPVQELYCACYWPPGAENA